MRHPVNLDMPAVELFETNIVFLVVLIFTLKKMILLDRQDRLVKVFDVLILV